MQPVENNKEMHLVLNNLFSLLFGQVAGIAVISVGVWRFMDKAFMEVLLRNNLYMSATYIMIGTGCVAIVLSILGCVGALKVSTTLQSMMNVKLSLHGFWHCHENRLFNTIQTIPHSLYVSVKSASLY